MNVIKRIVLLASLLAAATTAFAGPPSVSLSVTVAPPPVSPDGATSYPPNGATLVTTDGKWTWGGAAAGRPGEYTLNLNGAATPAIGAVIEVGNGGKLYFFTLDNGWWVWSNGAQSQNTGPAPATIPVIITLNPANPTIQDNATSGSVISTASVRMSDGSAFSGALTVSDTTGFFAVSGMNILAGRNLAPADDGAHTTIVSVK